MCRNTAIIIVNWNTWQDTVRCISACAHLESFDGSLFVIDNGSINDSYAKLQAWLAGGFEVESTAPTPAIGLLEQKPAENFFTCFSGDEGAIRDAILRDGVKSRSLYLVCSEDNKGFGVGNNIGIRLAMLSQQFDLFWCLNSDAITIPSALNELEMQCLGSVEPLLAGSVLLDYLPEPVIQTVGSDFDRLSLKVGYKFGGHDIATLKALPDRCMVDYPIGASLVLNRAFVETLGMFDERYFLYYEEPDLAIRLRETSPFICTKSLVYHKGGQSTGGGSSIRNRSLLADYHYNRSRAILAAKIGWVSVVMVFFGTAYSFVRRVRAGRLDLARRVFPAFLDGLGCV